MFITWDTYVIDVSNEVGMKGETNLKEGLEFQYQFKIPYILWVQTLLQILSMRF